MWPFRRRDETRSALSPTDPGLWSRLFPFFGFGPTGSGVTLTAESPLGHDAVLSCVNVIAEGCAMLAPILYRRTEGGRAEAVDHPLHELLTVAPCPHMSAFQYWKLVHYEKLHYGNHFSLIVRDGAGAVRELRPVEAGRVTPFWWRAEDGLARRAYRISMVEGGQRIFLEDEVFHLQNLPPLRGPNYTLFGASVWQLYLAETMGGALATNQFASRHFANGAALTGMISVPGALSNEQANELRDRIEKAYAGVQNAGRIGVFGAGATFTAMSTDAQKAQLLETRKFNRSVIAGVMRVSAHLINDLDRATFSNVEHLDLAHYKHCLQPHLTDLRQTLMKDVLTPEERRTLVFDHDETELLRGDQVAMATMLEKAVQTAQMTPNEARLRRKLPRSPDPMADRLFVNAATLPLSALPVAPPPPARAERSDDDPRS
jgi:HK97 family phage portal protein